MVSDLGTMKIVFLQHKSMGKLGMLYTLMPCMSHITHHQREGERNKKKSVVIKKLCWCHNTVTDPHYTQPNTHNAVHAIPNAKPALK
jgi:hypothetical protein